MKEIEIANDNKITMGIKEIEIASDSKSSSPLVLMGQNNNGSLMAKKNSQ